MRITSDSFGHGGPIPDEFAFGKPDPKEHFALSANRNPQLRFHDVPSAARSLVLLCVDPDVPTDGTDVNQEGKSVSAEMPRTDFYHWVMVDISPDCPGVEAGSCSDGITPRGKQSPPGPEGSRQGVNDYTGWFADDEEMSGTYHGYDGPAPPWNDERLHHYHFKLFALNVPRVETGGAITGPEVVQRIRAQIIAECEIVGTYTMNPKLRGGS